MSPSSIRFEREAVADVVEAALWYEAQRPGLGDEFRRAVESAALGLATFPNSGAPVSLGSTPVVARQVRAGPFPYLVVYVARDEFVRVVAVAYEKRLPGFWTDRGAPD